MRAFQGVDVRPVIAVSGCAAACTEFQQARRFYVRKLTRNPDVFGCRSAPVRHFFVLDGLALIEIGKAGSFDG
jgi:hypothetical protein